MSKALTTLFFILAFLFLYACGSSDPTPTPQSNTTHKVTFNPNTPSAASATVTKVPAQQNVDEGNLAIEPTTPALTGYTFAGWYTEANATNKFTFTTKITKAITLYAKWIQHFTVTYHANIPSTAPTEASVTGVPENPVSNSGGQTATAPSPPTLTGYNFAGWYTEATTTNQFDFSQIITASIDLYAKWTIEKLTIIYHGNKPQGLTANVIGLPDPVNIDYNQTTTVPTPPTLPDYNFIAWYTQDTGGTEFDFSQTITAKLTTVYARWNRIIRTITYHGNLPDTVPTGVSITNLPDPATINVNSGDTATPPTATPTLQDYDFQGWFAGTTTTGTIPILQNTAFAFETTAIKENKDLYTKWERTKVNITFYGNKPSTAPADASITGLMPNPKTVTVNSGETTTALNPPPELTGYTLDGWYIGTISGDTLALQDTAFAFTTTIIRGENINLYAKWTKRPLVSFNTQGGSTVMPQTITEPTNMARRPNLEPTREGYSFNDWYTMATGGNEFDFSRTITASITVYAQWTRNTYTVTFNNNYGETPATSPVTTDQEGKVSPPDLSTQRPEEFSVIGWFKTNDGSDKIDDFATEVFNRDITLYAKWIFRPSTKAALVAEINRVITNTTPSPNLNYIDTSLINDMSDLFKDKITFNGNISEWNVSDVNNMNSMFSGARYFNQNISSWNVSLVQNMSGMFEEARSFNQNISSWNVSRVENMSSMFAGANAFNQNISNWNVSNVNNMNSMFSDARFFNQNISSWNVSRVENMSSMFASANAFNGNISSWNVAKVTNMYQMFKGARFFNQNISSWNVSLVQNMSGMFNEASAFNQNISSWNVSNVNNMNSMFASTSFNQNISSWNVAKVTNMGFMFHTTSDFNQNISSWNVSLVQNMSSMFSFAYAFNQNISSWNVSRVENMSNMFNEATVFNGSISSWNVSLVNNMNYMFAGATAFNGNISSWNVSKVTNMSYMFAGATAFNQNISSWNVSLVNNMSNMFSSASAFNQNISSWNVSLVNNMSNMFSSASAFNQNISSWNVSLVNNMSNMFSSASAFNQNISSWNVSNVEFMDYMFNSATAFNGNISSWNVSLVNNMSNMFANATAFNQNISNWNVAKVTNMFQMFYGAIVFNHNISSWNVEKVRNHTDFKLNSMLTDVNTPNFR